MANPELGHKQICPSCSAKFYDLSKRPAVCPKCGNTFDPEEALKVRRVRSRVPDYESEEEKPKVVEPDEEGFEDEVDDTPEIDQASEADVVEVDEDGEEAPATAAPAEDIGVDFAEEADLEGADGDEVPFLEDEEEDDFAEDDIEGLPEDGDEPER